MSIKLDSEESILLTPKYYSLGLYLSIIVNIIFQPFMFYIIWDMFSKGEIPILAPIASFFLGFLFYTFNDVKYVITNKRVFMDNGIDSKSMLLSDIESITTEKNDKSGGSKYPHVIFRSKRNNKGTKSKLALQWCNYSNSLKDEIEKITSIKIEENH